jgi:small subunit ribosomal protein S8
MLTRIRNANRINNDRVDIPLSNLKKELARILKEEGYIKDFRVVGGRNVQKNIRVYLKYGKGRTKVLSGLKRVSRPGLRVYAGKEEIPKVMGGLGICIMSTPKGIMTGKNSKEHGIGGEVLCYVW